MPRPGPRPYECVRRAWHSERHQPIRGSLIQEIFRIAHEIHNPATKKKKEWQEKLPIVVFKAEEIMYSKANSEDEYMDPKTLWDRTNDAINTIIRRDQSLEESRECLQPCIEAALHLGCIPQRTSRSQRNIHPRGYLTGTTHLQINSNINVKPNSSLAPPYANFLGKAPQNYVVPTNSRLHNELLFSPFPSIQPRVLPAYPLHFSAYPQQPRDRVKDKVDDQTDNVECDLSLRLGFGSSVNGSKQETRVKQSSSNEGFSLYCGNSDVSRGEVVDMGLMLRKRKAVAQPEMCSSSAKDYACLL